MSKRVETGPVRFGDDWPGIFIRGDDVLRFVLALEVTLDRLPDASFLREALSEETVKSLSQLLQSCNPAQNVRLIPQPDTVETGTWDHITTEDVR